MNKVLNTDVFVHNNNINNNYNNNDAQIHTTLYRIYVFCMPIISSF